MTVDRPVSESAGETLVDGLDVVPGVGLDFDGVGAVDVVCCTGAADGDVVSWNVSATVEVGCA
jgi:hypothetical protein